jgi:hypothetical protein
VFNQFMHTVTRKLSVSLCVFVRRFICVTRKALNDCGLGESIGGGIDDAAPAHTYTIHAGLKPRGHRQGACKVY